VADGAPAELALVGVLAELEAPPVDDPHMESLNATAACFSSGLQPASRQAATSSWNAAFVQMHVMSLLNQRAVSAG